MTCTPTSTPGCGSRRSPPTRRMHLTSPTAPPGSPRRCVAPASRWSRSGRAPAPPPSSPSGGRGAPAPPPRRASATPTSPRAPPPGRGGAGPPAARSSAPPAAQPVAPRELWVPPPFEPTRVDGPDGPELHARGAIDDKGNVAFHLLGMRAHLAATGRDTPAVTVKLLIEGEEESGSPHFAALLRERAYRLACDVVVVSDTGMAAPDVPSAVTAMRGLADAEITLRGPAVDLHSGSFGGAVPNPLHAMAQLLTALHDEHGRVTLPGFYDKVRPLSDRERELMAR